MRHWVKARVTVGDEAWMVDALVISSFQHACWIVRNTLFNGSDVDEQHMILRWPTLEPAWPEQDEMQMFVWSRWDQARITGAECH